MQRTLVIGAGVAGLTYARHARARGQQVAVIDKGRGPGGRLSTRREGDVRFDHGAQYFTVRDERFRPAVDAWLQAGVVAPWTPRLADIHLAPDGQPCLRPHATQHPRYVGVPGMSSICRHLADTLDVRFSLRAVALARDPAGGWQVEAVDESTQQRQTFTVSRVICAVPDTQARQLLGAHLELPDTRTQPCWAAMLAFDQPLGVSFDAAFVAESPLSWVACESSKPQRPRHEAWVLHASADWSQQHLEDASDAVLEHLTQAFGKLLVRPLPRPVVARVHRWRFALTTRPAGAPCFVSPDRTLGVCGDWCLGGRIEAAFLSGLGLAVALHGV